MVILAIVLTVISVMLTLWAKWEVKAIEKESNKAGFIEGILGGFMGLGLVYGIIITACLLFIAAAGAWLWILICWLVSIWG